MIRPDVRQLIKNESLDNTIERVETFIKSNEKNEKTLAKIDLLRLYGKKLDKAKFYSLALELTHSIKNPAIFREISRFIYFIEKDSEKAKIYAKKAISLNNNEPLWVYYIARIEKTYLEKLHDGIYLTSIPKNASTSLKTMMIEKFHEKKAINPHSVFGNPFFKTNNFDKETSKDDLKLISIRNPLDRFVSYYNKNIIEENSLQEELSFTKKTNEFGLDLSPSLDDFINNVNIYCYMFNDVLHHILPQSAYFEDIKFYDVVANINESHLLGEAISNKLNLDSSILPPRKMVSSKPITSLKINQSSSKKLLSIFSDDLNLTDEKSITKQYSFTFDGEL